MDEVFAREETEDSLTLTRRLSRFGRRLCVKHDFLSLNKVCGKSDTIRRFYDFWAPLYDLIYPRSKAYLSSAGHVVNKFVRPGDRVLDLGAGTGLLTVRMLPKALSVVAFDLHEKMLRKARRKVAREIGSANTPSAGTGFCQGNALTLPFKSESFDIVTIAFMLVYLDAEQKRLAAREIRRVLTPDGRLVILTCQGEIHSRFTTKDEWLRILTTSGYIGVDVDDFNDVFRTISALPIPPGGDL